MTHLETDVKFIATSLYSILFSTFLKSSIDNLAKSFGMKAKKEEQRKRSLNRIAYSTLAAVNISPRLNDDATATTPLITKDSQPQFQSRSNMFPPSIATNAETENGVDNISPLTIPMLVPPSDPRSGPSLSQSEASKFTFTSIQTPSKSSNDSDVMSLCSRSPRIDESLFSSSAQPMQQQKISGKVQAVGTPFKERDHDFNVRHPK